MLRRELLHALLTAPLLGRLRPWRALARVGGIPDAAGIYRRAFALVEGLDQEDRDRLGLTGEVGPDDPGLGDLIDRLRPALEALREGSAAARCDWGDEPRSGADLLKDRHGFSPTYVIRLAGLSARRHAAAGREGEALDDLFAGLTLARRTGEGGVLFARILECSGETAAFKALARLLPRLSPEGLDDLAGRLDALPDPEPASAAVGPESRFIVGLVRAKLLTKGPALTDGDWSDLGFDADEAVAVRRLTGDDRAAVLAHLDATGPAFAELARRLDLPRPGVRAAIDAFAREQKPTQPVVVSAVDAFRGGRNVVDHMRALRAMTRAALALVRGGEAAFGNVPDPFGDGPFALERVDRGFLVRSALRHEGTKPDVVLAFGDAPYPDDEDRAAEPGATRTRRRVRSRRGAARGGGRVGGRRGRRGRRRRGPG